MLNARFFVLACMILGAAALRLVPHWPNFTPIGAMALFGGAYFADRRLSFLVPFAALLLSDVLLGLFAYHYGWFYGRSMFYVYGASALYVCLGLFVRKRRSPLNVACAALSGSLLFFLISNFGVWVNGSSFPKTVEGLLACYTVAIPFFGYTLAGDAVYSAVLFGGFALAQHYITALREDPARASVRF